MARRRSQVVPDQGRKLLYLIGTHGDRRPRSRKADGLAAGPDEGGSPLDDLSPIVTSPATLAQVLGYADVSSVSRWCTEEAPIPVRRLARICRIFAIQAADFRGTDYATFVDICEGRAPSTATPAHPAPSAGWRKLVAAASGQLAILTADPWSDERQAAARRGLDFAIASRDDPDDALPEVLQGIPFWIRLTSPHRGARRIWAGWHLLLFNHDIARDIFRALLPRETNEAADWSTVYPDTRHLDLPRSAVLRHPASDLGPFAIVAVLTDEAAPRRQLGALMKETAQGPVIEATLDDLAAWIEQRIGMRRAAVARARYRVVARRA